MYSGRVGAREELGWWDAGGGSGADVGVDHGEVWTGKQGRKRSLSRSRHLYLRVPR